MELIEETVPWSPQGSREASLMQRAADELVLVSIGFDEQALRERARRAGGYWRPEEKAGSISYGAAARLRLLERIMGDI